MVLDPIPQSLPVHFFGSRPQPPTSRNECIPHVAVLFSQKGGGYTPVTYAHMKKVFQYRIWGDYEQGGSLKLYGSFAKQRCKTDDIRQKRPVILMSLLIVATP